MEEKVIVIDFKALREVLLKGKWVVIFASLITVLIESVILFKKPNEFTSTASVLPEFESASSGGFGKYASLASLAGINISDVGSSDAIRPDLYPNVINNTTFFLYLLEQPIVTSENKTEKFSNFYYSAYNIDSTNDSGGIISSIKLMVGIKEKMVVPQKDLSGNLIFISKKKGEIVEELKSKISAGIDKKTGIINISTELPDPVAAAYVSQISMEYLKNFVTNYRTEKSRKEVEFLHQRLEEAKGKYYNIQNKKAQYSDQFSVGTIRFQTSDIKRERIESEYRVSSTFYQQLFQQYETAKLKVQQETPVFKTLQKPIVPFKKSGPKRLIILLFTLIFTTILTSIFNILKSENYKNIFNFKC